MKALYCMGQCPMKTLDCMSQCPIKPLDCMGQCPLKALDCMGQCPVKALDCMSQCSMNTLDCMRQYPMKAMYCMGQCPMKALDCMGQCLMKVLDCTGITYPWGGKGIRITLFAIFFFSWECDVTFQPCICSFAHTCLGTFHCKIFSINWVINYLWPIKVDGSILFTRAFHPFLGKIVCNTYCQQLECQPLLTAILGVLYELGSQYDYAMHMHEQFVLQPTESNSGTGNPRVAVRRQRVAMRRQRVAVRRQRVAVRSGWSSNHGQYVYTL